MAKGKLLLASNSPRRRALLSDLGWAFELHPADIDETPLVGEKPGDYVLRLASAKALAAGSHARPGMLVVAADTTVVLGEEALGKPGSAQEALQMLLRLRARWHQVKTGLAVCDPHSGRLETALAVTEVHMRPYSQAEIEAYIASGDPFDKAGAYAIQNAAFHPVDRIQGCYANVVGLPLCLLARLLEKFGLAPRGVFPLACEENLGYKCSECEAALNRHSPER